MGGKRVVESEEGWVSLSEKTVLCCSNTRMLQASQTFGPLEGVWWPLDYPLYHVFSKQRLSGFLVD